MWVELLLGTMAVIGTAWGSWLTYRGVVTKTTQEHHTTEFSQFQSEINRLRDDLTARDEQARRNYEDTVKLRAEVHTLTSNLHKLQLEVDTLRRGAETLQNQIVELGGTPRWTLKD